MKQWLPPALHRLIFIALPVDNKYYPSALTNTINGIHKLYTVGNSILYRRPWDCVEIQNAFIWLVFLLSVKRVFFHIWINLWMHLQCFLRRHTRCLEWFYFRIEIIFFHDSRIYILISRIHGIKNHFSRSRSSLNSRIHEPKQLNSRFHDWKKGQSRFHEKRWGASLMPIAKSYSLYIHPCIICCI